MNDRAIRTLAVILHADVEGSTALVQRDETLAHERIRDAFRRLTQTICAYGGTAHEVRGDALLATFNRASDAVSASLCFQAENTRRNAASQEPILPEIRIGIAVGEVVIADGTLTGPDVVVAQRIEQLARPGAVCIQGAAYDTIPRRLPFEFASLGEQQVKGFEQPVRVYTVELRPGEAVPDPVAQPRSGLFGARRTLIAGLAGLLVLTGGLAVWLQPLKPGVERAHPASADKPSVAVLPFDNLSGDPEQDYFSDGLTADIITTLASAPNLLVIAHNSTARFKGNEVSVRDVARDLGVRYVLEGSVRRANNTLRITAQLIDALNGDHVWAQSYDRELEDIFRLQDEIAGEIGSRLLSNVAATEFETRTRRGTRNSDAYDLFLRGWEAIRVLSPSANARAIRLFEKAIEKDPEFARAYAYLALTRGFNADLRWSEGPNDTFGHAMALARKAVTLDPGDALTHRVAGHLYRMQGDYERALEAQEIAFSLAPNDADTLIALAFTLAFSDRSEEAVSHAEAALRLNPHAPFFYSYHAGLAYYMNRQFEPAAAAFERARRLNPRIDEYIHWLAACYAQLGRSAQARAARDELLTRQPAFSIELLLQRHRAQGEAREIIVEGHRKAGFAQTSR